MAGQGIGAESEFPRSWRHLGAEQVAQGEDEGEQERRALDFNCGWGSLGLQFKRLFYGGPDRWECG